MRETWLKPNRRAIWFGCVLPLIIAAVGAWFVVQPGNSRSSASTWIGVGLLLAAAAALAGLVRMLSLPPISYRDGQVLFNLRAGQPIAVPVEIVEAFFVGQGPANLPGDYKAKEKTMNLVARLAQRRTDFAERDVKPAFGNWSEGYVTVRGTWCEPLDSEVVRRLNRRLKEVKSQTEQTPADAAAH
jgi:hypothetical protein